MNITPLLHNINKIFSSLNGKKVVLYGLGFASKVLLENIEQLCFEPVAFLDKDKTSGAFMGLPIITVEQVSSYAEIIVITAQASYNYPIYKRIETLKDHGIQIYGINGKNYSADGAIKAGSVALTALNRVALLEQEIDNYDVISFDIFDTLLMRKCLKPEIVFDLLESQSGIAGFKNIRQAAEKKLDAVIVPSLEQIYAEISHSYPNLNVEELLKQELELEKKLLVARPDMQQIYKKALKLGKKIILVSDMYMSHDFLGEVLQRCGYSEYGKIYVSCEYAASKANGKLWDIITQGLASEKVLHIGDNYVADYAMPIERSVQTFLIDNTIVLLDIFALHAESGLLKNAADYIAVGLILHKVLLSTFNSTPIGNGAEVVMPQFAEYRFAITNMYDFGYVFWGAVTCSYMHWLVQTAVENKCEKLLFMSRDGWLWYDLYPLFAAAYVAKTGGALPSADYLYISRQASTFMFPTDIDDIKFIAEAFEFSRLRDSVRDIIKEHFDVDLAPDAFNAKSAAEVCVDDLLEYIESKCLQELLLQAGLRRASYLAYLESLGLEASSAHNSSICLVDSYTSNKVQVILAKMSKQRLGLLCFGFAREYSLVPDTSSGAVFAYEGDYSVYVPRSTVAAQSKLAEVVFASPEAQFLYIDTNGKAVFAEEVRTDTDFIITLHQGIKSFTSEMLDLGVQFQNKQLADYILAQLFEGIFEVDHSVKVSLVCYSSSSKVLEPCLG